MKVTVDSKILQRLFAASKLMDKSTERYEQAIVHVEEPNKITIEMCSLGYCYRVSATPDEDLISIKEPGSFIVPRDLLVATLDSFKKRTPLEISFIRQKKLKEISTTDFRLKLRGADNFCASFASKYDLINFPDYYPPQGEEIEIDCFPGEILSKVINVVSSLAKSKQAKNRYKEFGVHIKHSKNLFTSCATDGSRLILCTGALIREDNFFESETRFIEDDTIETEKINEWSLEDGIVFPADSISLIKGLLNQCGSLEDVCFRFDTVRSEAKEEKQEPYFVIVIEENVDEVLLTHRIALPCSQLGNTFPDISSLINTTSKYYVLINKVNLLQALKRVLPLTNNGWISLYKREGDDQPKFEIRGIINNISANHNEISKEILSLQGVFKGGTLLGSLNTIYPYPGLYNESTYINLEYLYTSLLFIEEKYIRINYTDHLSPIGVCGVNLITETETLQEKERDPNKLNFYSMVMPTRI